MPPPLEVPCRRGTALGMASCPCRYLDVLARTPPSLAPVVSTRLRQFCQTAAQRTYRGSNLSIRVLPSSPFDSLTTQHIIQPSSVRLTTTPADSIPFAIAGPVALPPYTLLRARPSSAHRNRISRQLRDFATEHLHHHTHHPVANRTLHVNTS